MLDGTDCFYISGITPALSEELQETLLSAVKFCPDHSIQVIYDANFRGKLWTADEANTFNSKILPLVDICLVNDEDLENAFGIKAFDNQTDQAIHEKDSFKQSLEELTTTYPNIKLVASILRNIYSAQKSDWQAILLTDHKFYDSATYNMQVVPEVAAGDAFGAAIVHGVLNNFKPQFQVDYAIAAATLKLTIPGDFNLSRVSEIRDAMTR